MHAGGALRRLTVFMVDSGLIGDGPKRRVSVLYLGEATLRAPMTHIPDEVHSVFSSQGA